MRRLRGRRGECRGYHGEFNWSAQHFLTLLILGIRRCAMVTSRIRFTAAQKAELWERWKNGQSTAAISRALERKNKTGVERIVVVHGGIVPAPRQRALAALRLEEREEISRGIAVGRPIRQIAQRLRRAPSTVSREIKRNGGRRVYRANWADQRAWERALRPKLCRLALHRELRWRVAQKLALQWSPEQISGWLKQKFSTDQDMQISHEAIYRSLFIQTRGVLKKERSCVPRGGCVVPRTTTPRVDRGISSIWANGRPRLRIAPCQGIGKETSLPGRTARTSPPSSSAIPASRCSSRSPARIRRLSLLRLPGTSASCLRSCDAP